MRICRHLACTFWNVIYDFIRDYSQHPRTFAYPHDTSALFSEMCIRDRHTSCDDITSLEHTIKQMHLNACDIIAKNYFKSLRFIIRLSLIHISYAEKLYKTLADKGYATYDFFLPGLVIDAIENRRADYLAKWAREVVDDKI